MDLFEKATKTVKDVGETVIDSAKSFGSSFYNSSKEQSELAGMKIQKSVIVKRLQEFYAEIGKKYMAYMENSDGEDAFDVSEIIEAMQPDLEKLNKMEASIAEKESNLKHEEEQRRKKKAKLEYEAEKNKLDKALQMDIITQEEYDKKISTAEKKLDNYELLRKISMQLQMGIITKEEYTEKVNQVLK